jgi:hypothetical protein
MAAPRLVAWRRAPAPARQPCWHVAHTTGPTSCRSSGSQGQRCSNLYKTPLLWLGITINLLGIAYMLWHIRRQRASMFALDAKRGEKLASELQQYPSTAACATEP